MSKPVLSVPGIDPARIECYADSRVQMVRLDELRIAVIDQNGPVFDGCWDRGDVFRRDAISVMNACIDHWRATGRLFPEPPPEPVECVCGILAKAGTTPDDRTFVICKSPTCYLRANTVEQWNTMQAALKAAKEGK